MRRADVLLVPRDEQMISPAIKPSRDPLNLMIAMALVLLVPLGIVVQCAPVPAAKVAPQDAGDGGWHVVVIPADFDAGTGALH
jgi:hypothetical protein